MKIRMLKYNFESTSRPKCFWESASLTRIFLKNILGWIFLVVFLLKTTSWACFVGLKLISHWKAHLSISFRSLFRLLAVLSGTLTVENRGVSSANNFGFFYSSITHFNRKLQSPGTISFGLPGNQPAKRTINLNITKL